MSEIVTGMENISQLRLYYLVLVASSISLVAGNLTCPGAIVNPDNAQVYREVTPFGNTSAGQFIKRDGVLTLEDCVIECCQTRACDVVFMYHKTCFLIACASKALCRPLDRTGKKFKSSFMVQIRAISDAVNTNTDQFKHTYFDKDGISSLLTGEEFEEQPYSLDDTSDGMIVDASEENSKTLSPDLTGKSCVLSTECPKREECVPKNRRSRQGLCTCQIGSRDPITKRCITGEIKGTSAPLHTTSATTLITNVSSDTRASTVSTVTALSTSETTPEIKHLVVSAGDNKILQLPENETSLSAFAVPKEQDGEHYRYEWTLTLHPEDDDAGTMGDKNSPTLKLTSLKEGLYTFKVAVTGDAAYGEAFVNVTVLKPKRFNKPPTAIINPTNQTVKLPNTETVLDGSASTDDDKIVRYHWEPVTVPINYQPELTDTATLQLKNLVPGFYKFMLTVTDSDAITNSTYANITVIKETDYPPTANAGGDVIIYLPQKEVILNGNLSTDDKGIKSWEWTKGPDTNKAVDMQNTRTPYLMLSNLEIGMYAFILKVTDTADQSSTAEVRVFVKPENNEVPVADAGVDQELTLPVDIVILDGSKSHDDIGIRQWEWKQLSGPNQAKLDTPDQQNTNASGLTKGTYVFQLTVLDEKKANDSKVVNIVVKQTENQPPKARAGGDKTVQLPVNQVILNGSASSDDLQIVSYQWTRDPTSLAAGIIMENSDYSPVLKLSDLIPGRYLFQLKVSDEQGASSTDTASLIVKPDQNDKDEIEMEINADIFWFTEEQRITLAKKLALLLHDEGEVRVHINKITSALHSGRVILLFNVEKITEMKVPVVQRGPDLVFALKNKLKTDSTLLDFDVLSLETVICQNNCSGHGACDQASKRCICEAFWMEDYIRFRLGDKESNCDWSILYVIIILIMIVVSLIGMVWACTCLCRRAKFKRPRKRHRYTLLDDVGDKESINMLPKGKTQDSSLMVSMSDTDSDTLFSKRQINGKANGYQKPLNGMIHKKKVRT